MLCLLIWSSIHILRLNQKNEAGKKLREILYDFLPWAQDNIDNWDPISPQWISALQKQNAAQREFRSFLRDKKRVEFNRAWEEYYYPEGLEKWFTHYMFEPDELEKRIENVVRHTH